MKPSPGTLYVVATPIGNLDDFSPRAQGVLAEVDVIAAEDTRRLQRLLSRFGLKVPSLAYHDHNEATKCAELIERIRLGESIALVSDAGTPLVSDPGYRLVSAARAAGLAVVPIPGPSAVLAALAVAGLPTDRFRFEGFLPRRGKDRQRRIELIASAPETSVVYESARRLVGTLSDLSQACGDDRAAFVGRELTKLHEDSRLATLGKLAADYASGEPPKGECVIAVAGVSEKDEADTAEVTRVLQLLLPAVGRSEAVRLTAAILQVPKNQVYRLALELGE